MAGTRQNMPDEFLACDWGTTHLRIQCFDRDSAAVIAETHSADGAARLAGEATTEQRAKSYCRTLRQRIAELETHVGHSLADLPIVISGMASSSIGWQELPYARLPLARNGSDAVWQEVPISCDDTLPPHTGQVFLISGAQSDCEVMRGEETQIFGLAELARREPDRCELPADAMVLLPGTHSKHVRISRGLLHDFQTFMTGELYALLGTQSVLRHSVQLGDAADALADDACRAAFADGVRQGARSGMAATLFRVRTRQLLAGRKPGENAAFLSGLLIGDELAHLLASSAAGLPLILAAAGQLADAYGSALEILGAAGRCTQLAASDVGRLSALGQSLLLGAMTPPR